MPKRIKAIYKTIRELICINEANRPIDNKANNNAVIIGILTPLRSIHLPTKGDIKRLLQSQKLGDNFAKM